MFDYRLERFKAQLQQYWAGRAVYQTAYANEVAKVTSGKGSDLVEKAIQCLVNAQERDGTLTKQAAQEVEVILSPLAKAAKEYQVVCAAHAHIDMNWMWRWDETVAITLDTFQTMLDLMREYPEFKFSQSQASTYQIAENYAPEMLQEIRQRVREGRWEVTASTWVEADKNLPNGESHARHLLYTRRYLSRLLDLKPEQFKLDFEPDTFGHHANVAEILASGGVRYYYHCRGDQDEILYRWQAPSGREIVVYREPHWYLGYIEPSLALYAPAFCKQHGMKTFLKVYGVGDHGGGPTRRDIERLQDMATWPVFPTIRLGTFADFYTEVEKVAEKLPVVKGELNFVFTGCYTSQSRIKRANRIAEATLNASEAYSALAELDGAFYPAQKFMNAWCNTLFNQFHDIIPGSGVIDTREYALGLFQQTLATANAQKRQALRKLSGQAENRNPREVEAISEGAGVGFGVEEFRLAQVSRGAGKKRLFHVFNPGARPRHQVVELVVWDWVHDLERLVCLDDCGKPLPFQALDRGFNGYWGHNYLRLLVQVEVPACGYRTIVVDESEAVMESVRFPQDPRVELPWEVRLENEHLKASFDRQSCALVSLVDKASGAELVDGKRFCGFRRIQEDDHGMTAWVVGRYKMVENLDSGVRLLEQVKNGAVRQSFTYEVGFGSSKLTVTVSLDAGSRQLEYTASCDWHEVGRLNEGVPQLNFTLPLMNKTRTYQYDIPFGTQKREDQALDVPGNSWGAALPADGQKPGVQLVTEGNYGFRGDENALSLTLIRSSFDPDPYPELGVHRIRFAAAVHETATPHGLVETALAYTLPLDVISGTGAEPSHASLLRLESESVVLAALKAPESPSGKELILRLYEIDGKEAMAAFRFEAEVGSAWWVDTHEQPVEDVFPLEAEGKVVRCKVGPYRLATLRVSFKR
jgi:alpha-mannosidase